VIEVLRRTWLRIKHPALKLDVRVESEIVGYSTLRVRGDEQATLLNEIVTTSADTGLAGWLVWTAYDFSVDRSCYPSPCQSPNNGEHYFGMWDVNGDAKPALAIFTDAP
jgi:hypothetical protein